MHTEEILKKHGLRNTKFRNEVLQVFCNYNHALSSNDIENILNHSDRITLYRTLKHFEEKGVIHKAIDGTSIVKYALCEADCSVAAHHDHHVHFHCQKCENTFCLEHVHIPTIDLPSGYTYKSMDMVVEGICNNCA